MELVSFGKVIYILNQIVHDGYKLIATFRKLEIKSFQINN